MPILSNSQIIFIILRIFSSIMNLVWNQKVNTQRSDLKLIQSFQWLLKLNGGLSQISKTKSLKVVLLIFYHSFILEILWLYILPARDSSVLFYFKNTIYSDFIRQLVVLSILLWKESHKILSDKVKILDEIQLENEIYNLFTRCPSINQLLLF